MADLHANRKLEDNRTAKAVAKQRQSSAILDKRTNQLIQKEVVKASDFNFITVGEERYGVLPLGEGGGGGRKNQLQNNLRES